MAVTGAVRKVPRRRQLPTSTEPVLKKQFATAKSYSVTATRFERQFAPWASRTQ
jgi:hypothetical protein